MSPQGGVLIALLLTIAGLHLYWGFGGLWPAQDANALRATVVGAARGAMPGLVPSAMVAGALAVAGAIVVARHSAMMDAPMRVLILGGYVVLVAVFALRGLAPYVTPVFNYARGQPFYDLNLRIYAPLCLIIAALFVFDFPGLRTDTLMRLAPALIISPPQSRE